MKIYKLSLAVALLINSTSAIKLHKAEKNLVSIKSEVKDEVNLSLQSKIESIKNEIAKVDFNTHEMKNMLKEKDNENAIKTIKEMRNDLVNIADDIELAQKDAKHQPEQLKEISGFVSNISGKVGVVQDLEKRLDIMQGLDPLMGGILEKMNQVTDHSEVVRLQQENAADVLELEKTKSIAQKDQKSKGEEDPLDDAQSLSAQILGKPSVKTATESSDSNEFVVGAGPLSGSKEGRIQQIIANTMKQIDENDKYNDWDKDDAKSAALRNLHDAASTGSHVKDIKNTMPDFSVEEHTHIDHDHPGLPPHLSKQTIVTDVRPNTVDAVGPTMVSNSHSAGRPGAPHVPYPAPRVAVPAPVVAAHPPVMAAGYAGYPAMAAGYAGYPAMAAAAYPAAVGVAHAPVGYPQAFTAQSPYMTGPSITTVQHAPGVGSITAQYQPGLGQTGAHSAVEQQVGFQGDAPDAGAQQAPEQQGQIPQMAPQQPQSQPQISQISQMTPPKQQLAKEIKNNKEIKGAQKLLDAVKDFNKQNDIDEGGMKTSAQSIFSSLAEHDSYVKHNGTHADVSSEDPTLGTDEIITDVQI